MRITQLTISVLGLMLLAVAVYELAGRRAALVAMWLMAIEPTNVFFSTYLHKEPNMILASGMVAFGGAMIWKYAQLRWIALITAGLPDRGSDPALCRLVPDRGRGGDHAARRPSPPARDERRSPSPDLGRHPPRRGRRPDRARGLDRREPRAEPAELPGRQRRRRRKPTSASSRSTSRPAGRSSPTSRSG